MGYYNIRLFPAIQDMTPIITELEKIEYNCLPVGMCAFVDIFQDKLDKLLRDIEALKTYIDDILVLSNKSFSKHK